MRFTEEDVYLTGAALSLMVSVLIWIPAGRASLKWYWNHNRAASFKDKVSSLIISVVAGTALSYAVCKFFHYSSVIYLIVIGSLLEVSALGIYYSGLNKEYSEKCGFPIVADEHKILSYLRLNVVVYSQLAVIFILNMALGMGMIAATRWFMPDVAEIQNGPKRSSYEYKVNNYYALPFTKGLRPGASYIDNRSEDTVYRVVVNYAYLGEEECNHYAVTHKYAPSSFSRMPTHTFHVMDTIAPVMPSSSGKMGRYRTQRTYLTDNEHLWDFRLVDMRRFGLKKNRQVDSIHESRNMPDRENNEKYRAYKTIFPLPYPRLRPIPDLHKAQ